MANRYENESDRMRERGRGYDREYDERNRSQEGWERERDENQGRYQTERYGPGGDWQNQGYRGRETYQSQWGTQGDSQNPGGGTWGQGSYASRGMDAYGPSREGGYGGYAYRYGQGNYGTEVNRGVEGSYGGNRPGGSGGYGSYSEPSYTGPSRGVATRDRESYPNAGAGAYSGSYGNFGGGIGSYMNPSMPPAATGSSMGSFAAQQGRYVGRGPRNWQRSDDRIREDINERLTQHPDIDASDIEVQVQNGEVTLSGKVDERAAKRMAEDLADSVSGVRQVHNQIRVESGSSMTTLGLTSESSGHRSSSASNRMSAQEPQTARK